MRLKYVDMRFLISSDIQKNSIIFSSSWCLTEPYAFSRSNQMTLSSVLWYFTVFIRSHNIVVCLIQPGKPGTPAFWIDVLTYPLFITNLVILFAMTPKKILPSTFSNEFGRNCSIFLVSFSFGMWIPSANPQFSAINFFVYIYTSYSLTHLAHCFPTYFNFSGKFDKNF